MHETVNKKWWTISICIAAVSCIVLAGCNRDYTPKPKAYPRVVFPEHQYKLYNPADCPFKFEIPVYASVQADTNYYGHKDERCWLNVNFPNFNGTINLTFKDIDATHKFEKLVEDAHTMTYKHTKKADFINEIAIVNPHGVRGLLYDVGGDAASNVQFFLSDTTRNFLRGALYFDNEPNTDSMAPVVNFVKEDMRHMLQTFEWK